MNKFKYLLIFLLTVNIVKADDTDKFRSGTIGSFYGGLSAIENAKLNSYLKQPEVLGASFKPRSMAYGFGGELLEVFNKFIIGGGAYTVMQGSSSTLLGSTRSNIRGIYLKIGYQVWKKKDHMLFIHSSIGANTYAIDITNFRDSGNLYFNRQYALAAGKEERYSLSSILADLGLSLKTLSFSQKNNDEKKAGFILGFDAGLQLSVPMNEFHSYQRPVVGPPPIQKILSPYLRISLGGGSF